MWTHPSIACHVTSTRSDGTDPSPRKVLSCSIVGRFLTAPTQKFHATAAKTLKELEEKFETMEKAFLEAVAMFGEDPKSTTPEDFFSIFYRFIELWNVRPADHIQSKNALLTTTTWDACAMGHRKRGTTWPCSSSRKRKARRRRYSGQPRRGSWVGVVLTSVGHGPLRPHARSRRRPSRRRPPRSSLPRRTASWTT